MRIKCYELLVSGDYPRFVSPIAESRSVALQQGYRRGPVMWNIYPALAQSVVILLLADFAILREILMRLDTPDRLVRGSPAIHSNRSSYLLASRIMPAPRGRISIAPIAPSVADEILAVHRSAHSAGVTCVDRITALARLSGISRSPDHHGAQWTRSAPSDTARREPKPLKWIAVQRCGIAVEAGPPMMRSHIPTLVVIQQV